MPSVPGLPSLCSRLPASQSTGPRAGCCLHAPPRADAVRDAGGVAEGTLCYTGDVLNKSKDNKYNLDYYVALAGGWVGGKH